MKILRLYPTSDCEQAGPVEIADFDQLEELDSTPRLARWVPIAFEILTVDGDCGIQLRHADFPWLGSYALVLRDKAIELATPILTPFGELLPLQCAAARLALFNPLCALDVLDTDRSEIDRFRDGRIMGIEDYVFRSESIPTRAVFRIPQEPTGRILYTQAVVNDLLALGLAGLDFTTVWDSEES